MVIAVSLVELARQSWRALDGARPAPDIDWVGFAVVAGTIVINGFVSRYERNEGSRLASPLLVADAHHTRSDMYASGAVLLSFVGAQDGAQLGRRRGRADRERHGGQGGLERLPGERPVPGRRRRDRPDPGAAARLGVVGVANIHRVRSRGTRLAMELDLHLEVEPAMTVDRAHTVAHALEDELRREMPYLADVVVHVEPAGKGDRTTPTPTPTTTPPR